MSECKNCGHNIQEADKYCSNCGQKNFEKLRLKTLLGELASAYVSWDSKLFRSMGLLLFKPGQLSRNYIKGKRKGYVAPLRMYLFFSVLFFISLSWLGFNQFNVGLGNNEDGDFDPKIVVNGQEIPAGRDSLLLMDEHDRLDELDVVKDATNGLGKRLVKQGIRSQLYPEQFNKKLWNNISLVMFLLIPLLALLLKFSHMSSDLDYIEHLIFALYSHSFIFFMFSLMNFIGYFVDSEWLVFAVLLIITIHVVAGTKRFYQRNWFRTITKFIGVSITYLVCLLISLLATLVITLYIQ